MLDDKSKWLMTEDLQAALAGYRNNDIKVEIQGIGVPLAACYYEPAADCWMLVPYDGEDLKTALA
jgi:hypothetical protein